MARPRSDIAPAVMGPSADSNEPSRHMVWLRIAAFLSLKAPNTELTYAGILREYCEFLGAPYLSNSAADRILKAQDLHAIAFKAVLEKRPGETPRVATSNSHVRDVSAKRAKREKRTGLEATQSNATIAKKFAVLRRIYRMLIGRRRITHTV